MGPAVLAEAVEPVGCEEAGSVGTTDKYEDWPIVVGVSASKNIHILEALPRDIQKHSG